MSIHPQHADAILDGRKQVEFRKRPLADDITTVVVYATAPTKRIVGEFVVCRIMIGPPDRLWPPLRSLAFGTNRAGYDKYYAGHDRAVGLVVGSATRYPHPVPLAALVPQPHVPMSFVYLPVTVLQQLRTAAAHDESTTDRHAPDRRPRRPILRRR